MRRAGRGSGVVRRLGAPLTPAARIAAEQASHPMVRILLERAAAGTKPGRHGDGHRVALAVEGGGHAGVVSAGMCVLLEALGLVDALDVVYGASAGALNGSFTAAGQAALGATNYEDTANRRFSNPGRLLTRRPVIDFPFLFEEVIGDRKPIAMDRLAVGPTFCALAIALDSGQVEVLRGFSTAEELLQAVKVSCWLPVLSGPPQPFRGVRMVDGALHESIPYPTALAQGATHVLVLRSRPASYRKEPYNPVMLELIRRTHPELVELARTRHLRYNAAAQQLAGVDGDPALRGRILQITPVSGSADVRLLEHRVGAVRAGLRAGAAAAAEVFTAGPVWLYWQPHAYLAATHR